MTSHRHTHTLLLNCLVSLVEDGRESGVLLSGEELKSQVRHLLSTVCLTRPRCVQTERLALARLVGDLSHYVQAVLTELTTETSSIQSPPVEDGSIRPNTSLGWPIGLMSFAKRHGYTIQTVNINLLSNFLTITAYGFHGERKDEVLWLSLDTIQSMANSLNQLEISRLFNVFSGPG